MIMMTLHFRKEVPFKTVYVTGLIRDEAGQKMSKSKGNVLDPLDMIDGIGVDELVEKRTGNMMQPGEAEKIARRTRKEFPEGIEAHGTDALRFTLLALASTGRDINWDMTRLEGYRNFCNKLWNASRYVLMNTENEDCAQNGSEDYELGVADRWIISQLQRAEQSVNKAINDYRFDLAATTVYEFIWNQYCDWYLELSKPVLWDDNASEARKKGTRRTLVRVLDAILRLSHPLIPYITEEIWQSVGKLAGQSGDTLMLAAYPMPDESKLDAQADAQIAWLKTLIVGIRNIRGEMNIPPSRPVPVLLRGGSQSDRENLDLSRQLLIKLANVESIEWLESGAQAPMSSTALAGDLEILVPMAGLIDASAEIERLEREIIKFEAEMSKISSKLSNDNFVQRAPEQVVAKERDRLGEVESAVARLQNQVSELKAL